MSEIALKAESLGKTVVSNGEHLDLLNNINLTVAASESLAIIGTSGSGKSTLLGLLAGLDTPSSGNVTLLGDRITEMDEDQRAAVRARGVSFVFQNFQLLNGLTATENVMLPLEIRGESSARAQAMELLDRVGLSHRLGHYPGLLSGGEQQRVAIARAFAGHPSLLFADEPTGNLDRATGLKVEDLLFDLNREQGTTLVLVTHDERLANRCQRQVRMDAGVLTEVAV